jgi:predicted glycoside hydrolase/deacetylase ChbG (UPF0249 family)
MKIIINADDFGKNEFITKAICECFQKKYINTTTLMVNMPYAKQAVEFAKNMGFLESIGLHVNLTEGKPLTSEIMKCRNLCGDNGEFNAKFHRSIKTRLIGSKEFEKCVKEEVEAQFSRFELLTEVKDKYNINSHHHIHTDLSVWKPLSKVVKHHNVKFVRLSRNIYNNKIPISMHIYKMLYNERLRRNKLCCTKYFGSFYDFKNNYKFIKNQDVVEIMVHPEYINQQLFDVTVRNNPMLIEEQSAFINKINRNKIW